MARHFALDADITVSELRHEEILDERLRKHGALRVRRRNDVLGVLLGAEEWRGMIKRIEELEAEVEALEDAACRQIVAERLSPDVEFLPGSPEGVAEIQRLYKEMTGEEL